MQFYSDNTGPAHPNVMEALLKANEGYASSYGDDALMDEVRAKIRDVFEAPEAAVYLAATGTATNSALLATLCPPWGQIFAHQISHIAVDECNAPEFFTGGARMTLLSGDDAKIDPEALAAAMSAYPKGDVHTPQMGPLSLTQVTERGTVYTLDQIEALAAIARAHGAKVHIDGARFTNALVSLNCTPAQMTWKAGVDAVSFGGTKNGLLGVEAAVIFDPDLAWEFELRRKRAGHLFSKHRYLSAQMAAYLTDDLWLDLARASNASAKRLSDGLRQIPGATLAHPVDANMIFASFTADIHDRLAAAALHHMPGAAPSRAIRLVPDWSVTDADVDRYLDIAAG